MVKIILYGNGYIAKSIYKIVNIHYKEINIIGYTNTLGISDIDFEVEFIKKEK